MLPPPSCRALSMSSSASRSVSTRVASAVPKKGPDHPFPGQRRVGDPTAADHPADRRGQRPQPSGPHQHLEDPRHRVVHRRAHQLVHRRLPGSPGYLGPGRVAVMHVPGQHADRGGGVRSGRQPAQQRGEPVEGLPERRPVLQVDGLADRSASGAAPGAGRFVGRLDIADRRRQQPRQGATDQRVRRARPSLTASSTQLNSSSSSIARLPSSSIRPHRVSTITSRTLSMSQRKLHRSRRRVGVGGVGHLPQHRPGVPVGGPDRAPDRVGVPLAPGSGCRCAGRPSRRPARRGCAPATRAASVTQPATPARCSSRPARRGHRRSSPWARWTAATGPPAATRSPGTGGRNRRSRSPPRRAARPVAGRGSPGVQPAPGLRGRIVGIDLVAQQQQRVGPVPGRAGGHPDGVGLERVDAQLRRQLGIRRARDAGRSRTPPGPGAPPPPGADPAFRPGPSRPAARPVPRPRAPGTAVAVPGSSPVTSHQRVVVRADGERGRPAAQHLDLGRAVGLHPHRRRRRHRHV